MDIEKFPSIENLKKYIENSKKGNTDIELLPADAIINRTLELLEAAMYPITDKLLEEYNSDGRFEKQDNWDFGEVVGTKGLEYDLNKDIKSILKDVYNIFSDACWITYTSETSYGPVTEEKLEYTKKLMDELKKYEGIHVELSPHCTCENCNKCGAKEVDNIEELKKYPKMIENGFHLSVYYIPTNFYKTVTYKLNPLK